MVLEKYKILGDKIIIPRKELEEWRDHYNCISLDKDKEEGFACYMKGKADVLNDLLKTFEPLEP